MPDYFDRFDFEGSTGRSTPYRKQGDKKFDMPYHLRKRLQIAQSSKFHAAVQQIWSAIGLQADGQMTKEQYAMVHQRISRCLAPEMTADEVVEALEEDWRDDAAGKETLTLDLYVRSLFGLADMWASTDEEVDYVIFVNKLFRRITAVAETKLHSSASVATLPPIASRAAPAKGLSDSASQQSLGRAKWSSAVLATFRTLRPLHAIAPLGGKVVGPPGVLCQDVAGTSAASSQSSSGASSRITSRASSRATSREGGPPRATRQRKRQRKRSSPAAPPVAAPTEPAPAAPKRMAPPEAQDERGAKPPWPSPPPPVEVGDDDDEATCCASASASSSASYLALARRPSPAQAAAASTPGRLSLSLKHRSPAGWGARPLAEWPLRSGYGRGYGPSPSIGLVRPVASPREEGGTQSDGEEEGSRWAAKEGAAEPLRGIERDAISDTETEAGCPPTPLPHAGAATARWGTRRPPSRLQPLGSPLRRAAATRSVAAAASPTGVRQRRVLDALGFVPRLRPGAGSPRPPTSPALLRNLASPRPTRGAALCQPAAVWLGKGAPPATVLREADELQEWLLSRPQKASGSPDVVARAAIRAAYGYT